MEEEWPYSWDGTDQEAASGVLGLGVWSAIASAERAKKIFSNYTSVQLGIFSLDGVWYLVDNKRNPTLRRPSSLENYKKFKDPDTPELDRLAAQFFLEHRVDGVSKIYELEQRWEQRRLEQDDYYR